MSTLSLTISPYRPLCGCRVHLSRSTHTHTIHTHTHHIHTHTYTHSVCCVRCWLFLFPSPLALCAFSLHFSGSRPLSLSRFSIPSLGSVAASLYLSVPPLLSISTHTHTHKHRNTHTSHPMSQAHPSLAHRCPRCSLGGRRSCRQPPFGGAAPPLLRLVRPL